MIENEYYGKYKDSVKFGSFVFLHSKVSVGAKFMGEKLLLIEDDVAVGRIVKDALTKGCYVVTWQ